MIFMLTRLIINNIQIMVKIKSHGINLKSTTYQHPDVNIIQGLFSLLKHLPCYVWMHHFRYQLKFYHNHVIR